MPTTAQRYRDYTGLAIFSMGFRPFFLVGGAWAALSVPLWLAGFLGFLPAITRDWHVHEMLFGYLGAVIAGFLLTAIPNWTGRLPVMGAPLAALSALWCAGRAAMLWAPATPAGAIVDSLFLIALGALVAREVIAGRNLRNLPVCIVIALLAGANILTHFRGANPDLAVQGERAGIALIAMLLALIGGRITPSFTRNWLARRQSPLLPAPAGRFDLVVLAIGVVALLAWIAVPEAPATGALLALAGLAHLARLSRWRGWLCGDEPLVLILHVGYAWLGIGLLLLGASALAPAAVPRAAALHAITAGAFGVMTLAVMTRATRGHTGQELAADAGTQVAYLLVNAGALLRVAAPFFPVYYAQLVIVAAVLWSGAFAVFLACYGPLLLRPRLRA